jgi:hypothetical protein
MLPTVSQYQNAQKCAQVMCHILSEEMKLQYPQRFMLTEHGQFTWLLAVMDDLNLGGSMNKYVHDSTLHRLSTALDGLPVLLSNHTGLRYAVLLSDKPRLPQLVDYPMIEQARDVMPLGVGLSGPIHAHAKQIVNMIVVGAQDSGKSMLLRALAHTARLNGCDLYLADPIQHTFSPNVWGTSAVVTNNTAGLLKMLERLNDEILKRSALFQDAGNIPPEDLDQYNQVTGEQMPRVWLIADEANTCLASKAVQERLAYPAQIGRKYGIHIVLAGHDWHEYTVNRALTSYFETRLCLRTSNDTTGRIVLDDVMRGKRTMKFRQPGRAILRLRGQYQDVQLYNVSPDREREWFGKLQHKPIVDLPETTISEPTVTVKDEIVVLAERIRGQWLPTMSKNRVAQLLGWKQYGGGIMQTVNAVIEYLTSTSTTQNMPENGVFGAVEA